MIIFVGLYFSIFYILVLLNSKQEKNKIKDYPSVSIAVPAYNEEEGIAKTIESILKLKYPVAIKCYVINDCSVDNTLKIAMKYSKKYPDKIFVIDKKKNQGKAEAFNSALKIIKSDYVAVVDADYEVHKNSLMNLMAHFNREDGQEVGAVISKMRPTNVSKNLLERIQVIEYMMVGLVRSLSAKLGLLHMTPGVLSVYNTKILKKVGGFDKNNMTEDFESAVRVRKAGYLVDYSYESDVYTTTPNKFGPFMKQRIRWSRGFIQTHKKHKDLFFNIKYGLYGMYQFPLNVIGPLLYFLAIFAISFKLYKELYEFIFKLINTPGTITWFSLDSFDDILLGIDPQIDFLILVSFVFFLLFILSSFKFYSYSMKGQRVKNFFAFVVYIMFYNYIYIYVWIVSIYKEVKGEGYSWGRVFKDE
jgi:cellulose synthase/poly-beta-1,6-N-acetylglucosamine synthase-like glycosyltransferase